MYSGIYYLLAGELAVFIFFLVWFSHYTSTVLKVITSVIFLVALSTLATNKEIPIQAGRMWLSVVLALVAGLMNGIIGASNKNTIK